jgi:hypothetical protein
MLRLFHRDVNISACGLDLQRLLAAVAEFQTVLSDVETDVQGRRMGFFQHGAAWRTNHAQQQTVLTTDAQRTALLAAVHRVAGVLNLERIDWGQRFVIDCFDNTVVDILVHSVFDNHRLSNDPGAREMVLAWERHVINPVIRYLERTGRLSVLDNKPLIGDAKIMDTWCVFEDDVSGSRGMFHTVGSMLAKGYFKALVAVCGTKYLPSSFVGNLVAWGLHATEPEDRDDVYVLLSVIHSLPHYVPSSGVVQKVLMYEPGLVVRPTVDIISDSSICRFSDLRDKDAVVDIGWHTALLGLAKMIVSSRCP